jgi:hypothetical protein
MQKPFRYNSNAITPKSFRGRGDGFWMELAPASQEKPGEQWLKKNPASNG